jgi:ribonuclease R
MKKRMNKNPKADTKKPKSPRQKSSTPRNKKTVRANNNYPEKPLVAKKSLAKRVLDVFSTGGKQSYSIKQIFKRLQVQTPNEKQQAAEALQSLAQQREIIKTADGKFKSKQKPLPIVRGRVDFVNPRFAYVISDQSDEDIWVDADALHYALHDDIVDVQVFPNSPKGKGLEGEVVDIIERGRQELVGTIEVSAKYAFVIPDHRRIHADIFIPKHRIHGAKNGDKVVVRIVDWPTPKANASGEVIEVLGKAGENNTEMHAILAEFDLPLRFPPEVLQEAEMIPETISKAEIRKRRDLRKIMTFTIDPHDAKDFDDAISFQILDNGNYEIGVHIADVTHYVQDGSGLDKEAYRRATSVYLVDRVVPMLPERLSNGLCSLRPNEDKLTFSAVFEMTPEAQIVQEWFGKTIIHSDRRYAYEEAQEAIEGSDTDEMTKALKTLNALAKQMTKQRFANGAINFETTEVKFRLDENSKPIGIYIKERKDAHRLVEEFMLLANKRVAMFVSNINKRKPLPMVYRTHDDPDQEKLQNFVGFAKKFGYEIKTQGSALAASLNKLSEGVQGKPQQDVLQYLAIRTMAKAKYTTLSTSHFGLAFSHYTHFTSPIRRYPDMLVHRLLHHYLRKGAAVEAEELEMRCMHASDMEKRAADAERASIKYKQVEYMQAAERKVYEGVVTGVTEWGIYVEMIENKCEGMVRMSDIDDDFYELDADNYRIIGRRTKRIIAFGDVVKVTVLDANLSKRTIDLELVA